MTASDRPAAFAQPRALARSAPPRPVRLIHLGLGSFFRAHQAWYTERASDAQEWGYAAFAGRSPELARRLRAQDGAYTLVVRGPDGDEYQAISAISAVHEADDAVAWLAYWSDPAVAILTMTVTEAGYGVDPGGAHRDEVEALRTDPTSPATSAVGRLVAGMIARRRAGAGRIVLLPCDNLPDNGAVLRAAVGTFAEAVDPALVDWIAQHVTFGSTVVDRITPATTDGLLDDVRAAAHVDDAAPVVTEPYSEWVIACDFPAGRPDWDARFVTDVGPYERRKLWLLNGSHSLLAYLGLMRGHTTVDEAMDDPECRAWVEQWWDEARRHLDVDPEEVAEYRRHLVQRYGNRAVRHELAQIAADGTEKLPARVVPTLLAERRAGRPAAAACHVLGAWIAFAHGRPVPVKDPRLDALDRLTSEADLASSVPGLLDLLHPHLARDAAVVRAVTAAAAQVAASRVTPSDAACVSTGGMGT